MSLFDPVRRIVSGNKARYDQRGLSLDLVHLTDRIIIMGYPATGIASLYRNRRSDVLRFLEPYAPHYRIFNLCPLYENAYDASEFVHDGVERDKGKAVERFPWPDHHPPPLSLIPIMVDAATKWYEADERNVIVIHCKAGKGRSGTFAISILLALPGLPSPPSLPPPGSPIADSKLEKTEDTSNPPIASRPLEGKSEEEAKSLSMQDKIDYLLRFHTSRRMAPGTKSLGVSISSQRRWIGYWGRLLSGDDPRRGEEEPKKIVLEYIKVKGPGLKGAAGKVVGRGQDRIAVQVWRYKDSIAANLRKRELALATSYTSVAADPAEPDWDDRSNMFVRVGGLVEASASPSPSSAPPSATATPELARVASPQPLSEPSSASATSTSTASLPSALDADEVIETHHSSGEWLPPPPPSTPLTLLPASTASSPAPGSPRTRVLTPSTSFLPPPPSPETSTTSKPRSAEEAKQAARDEGGIVLDAEREVMLKFLVGKTGEKHGKLPSMAALALTWFIPEFECSPAPSGERRRSTLTLPAKDLDFVKPFAGIDEVEMGWRWL
ncbi:hypothetical protein JCM1841_006669 [Sporobolomyces salmonicolor]